MEFLLYLAGLAFAVILIGASAVYPFDSNQAKDWIKRGGMALALLLLVPSLILHLFRADGSFHFLLFLLLASPVAYWIREMRLRKDKRQLPRTRGAERTPILPREEEDQ